MSSAWLAASARMWLASSRPATPQRPRQPALEPIKRASSRRRRALSARGLLAGRVAGSADLLRRHLNLPALVLGAHAHQAPPRANTLRGGRRRGGRGTGVAQEKCRACPCNRLARAASPPITSFGRFNVVASLARLFHLYFPFPFPFSLFSSPFFPFPLLQGRT